MDDKVNTFNRCIYNTEFVNSLRERSLEEFLIQILDYRLLALEIIDVANVDANGSIEPFEHLNVHVKALCLKHLYHKLH